MRRIAYPHRFKLQFFATEKSKKPVEEKTFDVLAEDTKGAINGATNFGKKYVEEKGYARFNYVAINRY